MIAAVIEAVDEAERVEAWRTHVLCEDGNLSIQAAMKIAKKTDEDLHRVIRALDAGCSEEQALEIFT